MKPLIPLFFFFLLPQLFAHGHAHITHSDIIINICETCSFVNRNMNYNVCVNSLNSVPESHNSNLRGLGLIAVEIAIKEAAKIESKVSHMLNKHLQFMGFSESDHMYSGLAYCLNLYSKSLSLLSDAAMEIEDGNYGDASDYLSDAIIYMPGDCEAEFLRAEMDSPLTEENDEFTDHVAVALAITNLLQWHGNRRYN